MNSFESQLEFYDMILNTEKLFKILVDDKLIENVPKRCKNCYRYDTFKLLLKKSKFSENLTNKNTNFTYICSNQKCRTHYSPRSSSFFSSIGLDGNNKSKLPIQKCLEIIFCWSFKQQICLSVELLNLNKKTISSWYANFRNLCEKSFNERFKMGVKKTTIIEIDECLLRGKRKYNKGRYLQMDQWRNDSNASYIMPSLDDSDDDDEFVVLDESSLIERNNERYNNRIDGPWVVGICECDVDEFGKRTTIEVRFFYVEKRDSNTLIPLIKNEVLEGKIIYTDEWAAYRPLTRNGFIHKTVNHSKNYVSSDGSHTNSIEVCWHHLKTEIIRKMRNIPKSLLQSYLIEASIRSKYKKKMDFFRQFIQLIGKYHPIN